MSTITQRKTILKYSFYTPNKLTICRKQVCATEIREYCANAGVWHYKLRDTVHYVSDVRLIDHLTCHSTVFKLSQTTVWYNYSSKQSNKSRTMVADSTRHLGSSHEVQRKKPSKNEASL